MRLLALSDVHGNLGMLERILKAVESEKIGLVLLLGDLTSFGGKAEAAKVLGLLQGFEVMAIPGNLDTDNVLEVLEEKGISLHGKKRKFRNFTFVGFGGGLLGNPGRVLFKEEEILKRLENLMKGEKGVVLCTHLPPFGTGIDLSGSGKHIGSRSVKKVVGKSQPLLHLCGHAHQAFGEMKTGKTVSINVGAVKDGRALIVELGKEVNWKRIEV